MRSAVLAVLLIGVPSSAVGNTLIQRRPDAGDVVADAYLWTDAPTANTGASTGIYSSYTSGEKRALIQFELQAIPAGAVINSASLTLVASSADGRTVNVSQMALPWTETTANWNLLDGGSPTGSSSSFTATVGVNTVSVTSQVQSWVDGAPNRGFILIEGPGTSSTQYASSENAVINQRPLLTIDWIPPQPDAGPPDAGPPDAGPPDAGPPDAGPPDAGAPDAGPPDAGAPDAGPLDAGAPDAGPLDAGAPDAGDEPDAGAPDGGVGPGVDPADRDYLVGCSSAPVGLLGLAALALLLARRRRE